MNSRNMRYPVAHGVHALPDFGEGKYRVLKIDKGAFYGYNKAIWLLDIGKRFFYVDIE